MYSMLLVNVIFFFLNFREKRKSEKRQSKSVRSESGKSRRRNER